MDMAHPATGDRCQPGYFTTKPRLLKNQNLMMMKRNYLLLSCLLTGLLIVSSCKRDFIYGDITPNTDRIIVEFTNAKQPHSIAMDYTSGTITVDVAELEFMVRSTVKNDETVKIKSNSDIVNAYNSANGTSYSSVPLNLFGFEATDIVLTPSERKKKIRIRIKPSDVAIGEWAIGLEIASTSSGEVSQLANKVLLILSVKNKYDGKYHLKGFYTRTDNPPYNGPYETDVEMITTGPNSVAMYWPDGGDFYQPFTNNGTLTAFSNVAPEAIFNGSDQVSGITNYTGDPVTGPFMTPYPGANSRYTGGAAPVIYLKYYYNTNPANRIFADTLIYTGPR
jgi:hypothetical protein